VGASDLALMLWLYSWLVIFATMGAALWGIIRRPNMLKKIICLTVLGDTTYVFMNMVGYRLVYPVTPPIIPNFHPSPSYISEFVRHSVDPIPPTLTLTGVVINLAVTMLLVFIAVRNYRLYGTLDYREISRIKKEVGEGG